MEFCTKCAEPMENYSRPAGFWVRIGAAIIDYLIFMPILILAIWNGFKLKSTFLLILIHLLGLIYKPFMESYFGATLGKMSCGIKVIDDNCNKLSLLRAYIRFLPAFMSSAISLTNQLILFSSPEFESVTSWIELSQAQQGGSLRCVWYYYRPVRNGRLHFRRIHLQKTCTARYDGAVFLRL